MAMLQPLLQEFLIENGYLPIAPSGQLHISNTPAGLKENDKILMPPASQLFYSPEAPLEADNQNLISFLSTRLGISEREVNGLLKKENIIGDLSEESTGIIDWNKLCLFKKEDGTIPSGQDEKMNQYLPPVTIEKIRRQPVSEPAFTDVPQATMLIDEVVIENDESIEKDYWWVWALVIFFLSGLLILFWFI